MLAIAQRSTVAAIAISSATGLSLHARGLTVRREWSTDGLGSSTPPGVARLAAFGRQLVELRRVDEVLDRFRAVRIFGLMVGTLQLARALTDSDLSAQLPARGLEAALRLVEDRGSPRH